VPRSSRSVAAAVDLVDVAGCATQRVEECQDFTCGLPLEQPVTGRPRVYCDATCRKNAARQRAWDAWREAENAWRARDSARQRIHANLQAGWDALPDPIEAMWEMNARVSGFRPPDNWAHTRRVNVHGPRPADYVTPADDPRPLAPAAPRNGKKSQGYYW
jgi:hypothetical protein